jgi:hypothetical protein
VSRHRSGIKLWITGFFLVACAAADAHAASNGGITYNDIRVHDALEAVMTYLEGTFGSLVMAAAGIATIFAAAIGQYRAALSLLVVSVGAFTLRSFMSTFFNDYSDLHPTTSAVRYEQQLHEDELQVTANGETLEITAPAGSTVLAWQDGKVETVDLTERRRYTIAIDHGKGIGSLYAGLVSPRVKSKDTVVAGQPIGMVPHDGSRTIGFMVTQNGEPVPISKPLPKDLPEKEGLLVLAHAIVETPIRNEVRGSLDNF